LQQHGAHFAWRRSSRLSIFGEALQALERSKERESREQKGNHHHVIEKLWNSGWRKQRLIVRKILKWVLVGWPALAEDSLVMGKLVTQDIPNNNGTASLIGCLVRQLLMQGKCQLKSDKPKMLSNPMRLTNNPQKRSQGC
jgi:hypothetical protein